MYLFKVEKLWWNKTETGRIWISISFHWQQYTHSGDGYIWLIAEEKMYKQNMIYGTTPQYTVTSDD